MAGPWCHGRLLSFLQAGGQIGGKGSVRRKKTAVHKASTLDDKKLQTTLKRLAVNPIQGIEEVRRGIVEKD